MMRRWSMGAVTAVVLAIVSALTVAGVSVSPARWEFALRLSPSGVELSATSQQISIALTL